jgi:hypothetical protein
VTAATARGLSRRQQRVFLEFVSIVLALLVAVACATTAFPSTEETPTPSGLPPSRHAFPGTADAGLDTPPDPTFTDPLPSAVSF